MTIQKIAIKVLTSSNEFFKDFNCKNERLFFNTGFNGLLLLCAYSLFTSLNLHYSGRVTRNFLEQGRFLGITPPRETIIYNT